MRENVILSIVIVAVIFGVHALPTTDYFEKNMMINNEDSLYWFYYLLMALYYLVFIYIAFEIYFKLKK